jgi:hypothetical protein
MGMHLGRTGNSRSLRSKLGSVVGLGSVAALVLAGVAILGVSPASAANATNFVFSTLPTSTVAGATFPSFTVTYQNGNGATDTISLTSSCGLGGTDSATASGSVATFASFQINTGTSCTLTATDTSVGAGGASSPTSAITVTPTTANKLGFNVAPPTSAGAGVALTTFKVATEDQYGNVVTSATDNITVSSSCTLGGTTSALEVAGIATFSAVSINQVGSCILIASDTTNNTITAVSSSAVTVSGGTPAKVAFTVAPPATVAATGTLVTAFKAAVEDASGNVDTTGTGSVDSITLSSTCLAAPVSATATAGVATFSTVEFALTGTCTLTATDASRVLNAATATVQVGTPQAVLTVTSKSGYLDAPLTLAATGGSGTGALTFSVTNGTATGCLITAGALSATKGGTCIVTATKAAAAPYATGLSAATTVTISSAPKALRLVGTVARSRTTTVTVTGYNFSGRPRVISNVAGFTGLVTRDTGKSLTIRVTVKGKSAKPGVKTLALTFANGAHASVKYSLH